MLRKNFYLEVKQVFSLFKILNKLPLRPNRHTERDDRQGRQLLWLGNYTGLGHLKKDERVYKDANQPFRLQDQYCDEETGLHYNLLCYYEPEAGRFVNQDSILLLGGSNLYSFTSNTNAWFDLH